MASPYDYYDYPSYWKNRQYEHQSELIAIKSLLSKIPLVIKIVDVGAGYGRLVPAYIHRAKRITLVDPSAKNLKIARKKYFSNPKFSFKHIKVENLPPKIRNTKADLVVCVRVLHHIDNLDEFLKSINKILQKNGYLILEYANKRHFKSIVKEFIRGNFTFPIDIFPKELGEPSSLPFKNYHPDTIKLALKKNNFKIISQLSVSNVRSSFLKRVYAHEFLILVEKYLQKPLGRLLPGPSVFVLARKKN